MDDKFKLLIANHGERGCQCCRKRGRWLSRERLRAHSEYEIAEIKSGVEQFIASDVMPSWMSLQDALVLKNRGAEFGGIVPSDELLRYVRLPSTWKKRKTPDSQGFVDIFDEEDRHVGYCVIHNTCCHRIAGWAMEDAWRLQFDVMVN